MALPDEHTQLRIVGPYTKEKYVDCGSFLRRLGCPAHLASTGQSSGPNRLYRKPGLDTGQAQARGGRPACVARSNARNSIDPVVMGIDRNH